MSVPGLLRAGMIDMEPNTTVVQQFPAHEAVPDAAAPSPAVILLHDVWGLTPEIRALANRFGREGFFALAPNLYAHPFSVAPGAPPWMSYPMGVAAEEGWGGFPVRSSFRRAEAEEAKALGAGLSRARLSEIIARATGHLALASAADPARIALVGLGMGGRIGFRAACELGDGVRSVVVYSGTGIASRSSLRSDETMPILEYEALRAAALFFYGESDPEGGRQEREAVERVLASAGMPHEIVTFREAGRDFFDESSPDFRIAASREAWEKTLAFLRRTLAAPAGSSPK